MKRIIANVFSLSAALLLFATVGNAQTLQSGCPVWVQRGTENLSGRPIQNCRGHQDSHCRVVQRRRSASAFSSRALQSSRRTGEILGLSLCTCKTVPCTSANFGLTGARDTGCPCPSGSGLWQQIGLPARGRNKANDSNSAGRCQLELFVELAGREGIGPRPAARSHNNSIRPTTISEFTIPTRISWEH